MTYAIGKNLETCAHPSRCSQPASTWAGMGKGDPKTRVAMGFCTRHEDYPEEQHGQPE